MIQLETTADLGATNNCLIYGAAKSQKTRSILTAPKPIICSTDEGLSSLREFGIPYFACRTWTDYKKFETSMFNGDFKDFQTMVIDDLTELGELILKEEKPKHKNGMQAYGAMAEELARIVRVWRAVTTHITVTICKQEKYACPSDGMIRQSPKLPGKAMQNDIPYLFGQIYQTTVWRDPAGGPEVPCFRCKRDMLNEGGDRSGKLAEIEPLDLNHIFQKTQT